MVLELRRAEERDLRADLRAVRRERGHERGVARVAAGVAVGRDEQLGGGSGTERVQIHDEEREVVGDVDAT